MVVVVVVGGGVGGVPKRPLIYDTADNDSATVAFSAKTAELSKATECRQVTSTSWKSNDTQSICRRKTALFHNGPVNKCLAKLPSIITCVYQPVDQCKLHLLSLFFWSRSSMTAPCCTLIISIPLGTAKMIAAPGKSSRLQPAPVTLTHPFSKRTERPCGLQQQTNILAVTVFRMASAQPPVTACLLLATDGWMYQKRSQRTTSGEPW